MFSSRLPSPQKSITKSDARRFLLSHHHLWPPRQLEGKSGILTYIHHVGSIQFDPINIVGRNPDLVLQSRITDYRSEYLDQLLYEDRMLIDGWDKMASIYPTSDWPNFSLRRNFLRENPDPRKPSDKILDETLGHIRNRGPLSSLDFKDVDKVDWHWGPTKAVRAAMEYLFSRGRLGVHHRVNNRRYFDLIEELLPAEILNSPDPFQNNQEYQDWHVLRRIGSLGLTRINSGEAWGGILGVKTKERHNSINRLCEQGEVISIAIDGYPNQLYFIRAEDIHQVEAVQEKNILKPGAAIIAPLDNLLWNRQQLEDLFSFHYRWEVYKPKAQRQYGYYVLPVLYKDKFVARVEPTFDKENRILRINNWWWESRVEIGENMRVALLECLEFFCLYLKAKDVTVDETVKSNPTLDWFKSLI